MKPKISISWSGGKDSAMAFYRLVLQNKYDIVGIHTVIEKDTLQVGIHNVHEYLIEAQAAALGLPLTKLYLESKPMAYQKLMIDYYKSLKEDGIDCVMFGDIFLEDLKDFREMLLKVGRIKGIYPLWKSDTTQLMDEFFDDSFNSVLCAIDAKFIDKSCCGKSISKAFINRYPEIDPCGENGEYHSLVLDGPIFSYPLIIEVNDIYAQNHTFNVKDKAGRVSEETETFYYADMELSDKI